MIILQLMSDLDPETYISVREGLYKQGVSGLIVLPSWIRFVAITDDENIKIIREDENYEVRE